MWKTDFLLVIGFALVINVKTDFLANAVYNKIYIQQLNLNQSDIISIEPRSKVWFSIINETIYALPLFGDYPGPFSIHLNTNNFQRYQLQFDIAPSTSLFSPSNHLLLALFNLSSITYQTSTYHRYLLVRTLSLALNISETLLTIHRINGSMIRVYFSCDFYTSTNLTYQISSIINHFYSHRSEILSQFPLPLIEISIVRLTKSFELKKAHVTNRPRPLINRTAIIPEKTSTQTRPYLFLNQFYQPLVLFPLLIILIGLFLCSLIAICLCCNRRSSSSSTLLLPSGPMGNPNNKHLYQNYTYRKHREEQEFYKKKRQISDQRQFISKGIPVVFTEEIEEKLRQTHTPLVMRIERMPPFYDDQDRDKTSL